MTTWYEAVPYMTNPIMAVQVERHSDSCVWIGGRRRSRDCFFQTWEEARDALLANIDKEIRSAKDRLDYLNGRRGNIIGLKKP
jgi:hypothetical protein